MAQPLGSYPEARLLNFIGNKVVRGLTTSVASGPLEAAEPAPLVVDTRVTWREVGAVCLSGSVRRGRPGAVTGAAGGAVAFGIGKVIDLARGATWDKSRGDYWRREAQHNPEAYSQANLERMQNGLAPQRVNPMTGKTESMELHHNTLPQRFGLPRSVTTIPGIFAKCGRTNTALSIPSGTRKSDPMIEFEKEFAKTNGQPLPTGGKTYYLVFTFNTGCHTKIVLESCGLAPRTGRVSVLIPNNR